MLLGVNLKQALCLQKSYTCLLNVNNMYAFMFTCIQKCMHPSLIICIRVCRGCLQLRIQKAICLQAVYRFTISFLFSKVH